MTSLVTSRVDLTFRGICHVAFSGQSCHFRCQISLSINSRIPFLPFTFLKFSLLTFVGRFLIQKYFCIFSLPSSRARYFLHPRSQVFLQISSRYLRLSFLRLIIVFIGRQTSTTTLLVIVVPVVVVVVVVTIVVGGTPRTSNTRLLSLGFLQRFFKNSLGRGQLLGLELVPRRVFLCPFLQMRLRQYIVVLQESIRRRMKRDLLPLRVGTKFQTTLTLSQPFVGNDAVKLVLAQVFMKLTFQRDIGYPLMPLLWSYLPGQVQEYVSLTLTHGGQPSLCKFCGGKRMKGIVLSLWMSSSTITNFQRLTNPLAFINLQPGANIVD